MSQPSSPNPEQVAKLANMLSTVGYAERTEAGVYFVPHNGVPVPVQSAAFRAMVAAACCTGLRSQMTRAVAALVEARGLHNLKVARLIRAHDAVGISTDGTRHYMVNTGGGAIVEIREDGMRVPVPNGAFGVVFIDALGFEPVGLTPAHLQWDGIGGSYLQRLLLDRLPPPAGFLTRAEQSALVLCAWFTPFLSSLITGKPIWLFLGGPGVGKSVTQRGMAKAFYGINGNTSGGVGGDRSGRDIFAVAAHQPVVHRDDVNRISADTMDSFCQLATGMKLMLAKLYEDLELVQFDVKATFIFSAFAPRWLGRLDVMQRLLTIEFGRPPCNGGLTEGERMREILEARQWIWAESILVLAQTLTAPKRAASPVRFDDWYGYMHSIMTAYGCAEAFDSALAKLDAERVRIACGADPQVAALRALASNSRWGKHWSLAAEIIDGLAASDGVETREGDPHRATGVLRDPQKLGMLLQKAMTDYSGVVTIARRVGPNHTNEYRIWPAGQPDPLAETPPAMAGSEHRAL